MSDRYVSLTVLLDGDYTNEDADSIIMAIGMIKGVMSVTALVADPMITWAKEKARREIFHDLIKALDKYKEK